MLQPFYRYSNSAVQIYVIQYYRSKILSDTCSMRIKMYLYFAWYWSEFSLKMQLSLDGSADSEDPFFRDEIIRFFC